MGLVSGIPGLGSGSKVKKAPDPGSGYATPPPCPSRKYTRFMSACRQRRGEWRERRAAAAGRPSPGRAGSSPVWTWGSRPAPPYRRRRGRGRRIRTRASGRPTSAPGPALGNSPLMIFLSSSSKLDGFKFFVGNLQYTLAAIYLTFLARSIHV
jgi:hypothetical protein